MECIFLHLHHLLASKMQKLVIFASTSSIGDALMRVDFLHLGADILGCLFLMEFSTNLKDLMDFDVTKFQNF